MPKECFSFKRDLLHMLEENLMSKHEQIYNNIKYNFSGSVPKR